ncbi:uncharacterized protein DS421_18g612380 [Arachis hypogaea]|nr:uncharacterized protein DS421_18g612380 [Arachis hypogaea]
MGPKRGQKVVIKSTRKVVQESVQVSIVGSSSKRTRRNNKDIQRGNEVVGEENVRIIPVQEVTPQPKENEISNHIKKQKDGEGHQLKLKYGISTNYFNNWCLTHWTLPSTSVQIISTQMQQTPFLTHSHLDLSSGESWSRVPVIKSIQLGLRANELMNDTGRKTKFTARKNVYLMNQLSDLGPQKPLVLLSVGGVGRRGASAETGRENLQQRKGMRMAGIAVG